MTGSTPPPVVVRRVVPAPIEEVFSAWTDAAGMGEWFTAAGTAKMTADVRPGGSFRLVMSDENVSIEHNGVYRVVDPPHLLVFTWVSQFTGNRETLVSIRFSALGPAETEIVITHELLPPEQTEAHAGGWTQMLEHLDAYVRRGGSRSQAPKN